jgi:CheY-like chemotaxis protein
VVDDSLTVRRASQRLLERHGYTVALARDGMDALAQLRLHLPAAVLLDIEMPRMDGFELLTVLRDDPRWRDLPVAMITSRTAERHREHAMKLGATAYLGKPFVEEVEVTKINFSEWLGQHLNEDNYTILKMDIEGAEYDTLEKIISDGRIKFIKKLYIEWHSTMFSEPEKYKAREDKIIEEFKKFNIPVEPW